MSVTKVISVNEARGLFSQLQVAPPQFPSGLESITMNLFPLQDGSTLGCCEYFNIVFRGTQPLRIQGYDAPKLDMTLICDSDDSDDDIEIISGTIPKPVVPGPVVPMRSLSPPQPAPRQRYKVNQKAIFVGVKKKKFPQT